MTQTTPTQRHKTITDMLEALEPARDLLIELTQSLAKMRHQKQGEVDDVTFMVNFLKLEGELALLSQEINQPKFEQDIGIVTHHPRPSVLAAKADLQLNPTSTLRSDWQALANYLRKDGEEGLALDFEAFIAKHYPAAEAEMAS